MEILVIIAVFWVVGKILKGLWGGFRKSDYRRDRYPVGKTDMQDTCRTQAGHT